MVTGFVKMNNDLSRKIIQDCGLGAMGFYYMVLSHKNDSADSCYPSNECLMKECGITKPTLNKYITSLIEKGYLKVISGNVHRASNYYFPLEDGMYTENELDKVKSITRRKGSNKKKSSSEIEYEIESNTPDSKIESINKPTELVIIREEKIISDETVRKTLLDDLAIYYKDDENARDLINKKCNGRKFSSICLDEVREIYNSVTEIYDEFAVN